MNPRGFIHLFCCDGILAVYQAKYFFRSVDYCACIELS